MKHPTIIIPIYNAFDETVTCLNSVYKYTPQDCRILLIDDASSEGEFTRYLQGRVKIDARTEIYRNAQNLGFVKTCNRGMLQLEKNQDVILLNSDTEVTENWTEKLSKAAYSKSNIATVTPLTNNGTVCSVPHFFQDNAIPAKLTVDEFAALIEKISPRTYPILPTSVGFCVYIRRAVINHLGGFDEHSFGKGYGEENDFSCRGQKAGFVDILDDATFIYHKGSMSFREEKRALIERHSAILQKKHPWYFSKVEKFREQNPLKLIHDSIRRELIQNWMNTRTTSVLHILHNGPYVGRDTPIGGAELHVQDLIQHSADVAHWSLSPAHRYFKKHYFLTAHLPECDYEFILDAKKIALEEIIRPDFFGMVHLHHTLRYPDDALRQALLKHGNYAISLHDFFLIHPKFTLLDNHHRLCELKNESNKAILERRKKALTLLNHAKKTFCYSESTKSHFETALNQPVDFTIYPHGIKTAIKGAEEKQEITPPSTNTPLRLVFLGNIQEHKGLSLLKRLVKIRNLPNGTPLEWHIVGKAHAKLLQHVHQHGSYDHLNIGEILKKISPHAALILSIWPETYCYTMDEALNANVPTIVTPMGAIAERTLKNHTGWVIDQMTSQAVLDKLLFLTENWNEYQKVQETVAHFKLLSSREESAFYENYYLKAANKPTGIRSCFDFLEKNSSSPFKIYSFYPILKRVSPYLPKWFKEFGKKILYK